MPSLARFLLSKTILISLVCAITLLVRNTVFLLLGCSHIGLLCSEHYNEHHHNKTLQPKQRQFPKYRLHVGNDGIWVLEQNREGDTESYQSSYILRYKHTNFLIDFLLPRPKRRCSMTLFYIYLKLWVPWQVIQEFTTRFCLVTVRMHFKMDSQYRAL